MSEALQQQLENLLQRVAKLEAGRTAPNRDCLTVEEAAAWIGCTQETVRKYETEGDLPAKYPNSKRRYLQEDVRQFMEGIAPRKRRYGKHGLPR